MPGSGTTARSRRNQRKELDNKNIPGIAFQDINAISANQLAQDAPEINLPQPQESPNDFDTGMVKNVRDGITFDRNQFNERVQQRDQLLSEMGALSEQGSLGDLFAEKQSEFQIPGKMQELEDIELQLVDRESAQLEKASDIARQGGATRATSQRAISASNAKAAIRDLGLAARAAVLRGNIETASQLATQAVQFAYQDRQIQNQNLINQINAVQGIVDNQTAGLLEQDRRAYERDIAEVQRAQNAVDFVVSNGYAQADEIQGLVDLSGSPREQAKMAQVIANRGAAEMRGLQMENLSLQVAKNRASLSGLGQPDANAMLVQSLFGQGQPDQTFQEFLASKGMAGQSLMPEVQQELEEEYRQSFAVDPEQKTNTLNYLVATGVIKPATAEYLQQNLDLSSPQQQAKQEATVMRGKTVLRDVDRALVEVEKAGPIAGFFAESDRMFGTGPSLSARVSPAFELQQHLASIKSNISIDQLQAMREASPTGGALGQVPVQQQEFLMSVLGSLSPSLKPKVLGENLNDVYNVYLDVMFGSPQELSKAVKTGKMTPSEANSYIQARKETGFNEYNLPVNKSMGEDIENLTIAPNGDLVIID